MRHLPRCFFSTKRSLEPLTPINGEPATITALLLSIRTTLMLISDVPLGALFQRRYFLSNSCWVRSLCESSGDTVLIAVISAGGRSTTIGPVSSSINSTITVASACARFSARWSTALADAAKARRATPTERTIFTASADTESHVVVHRELVRMRTQPQRVVFFLFHVDPVGDEVGVEDVAAEEEGMIGLERFDRATE
jgi:hypothetical protein